MARIRVVKRLTAQTSLEFNGLRRFNRAPNPTGLPPQKRNAPCHEVQRRGKHPSSQQKHTHKPGGEKSLLPLCRPVKKRKNPRRGGRGFGE